MYPAGPVKLHDCDSHGPDSGAELFVVEGDSASKAVVRACDRATQAVLPMQGKPLNAWRARRDTVARNQLCAALIDALGCGWDETIDLKSLRYETVTLLFDPDADGIHCGALALMFFYRWMRPLLDDGRIGQVRAPLFEFSSPDRSEIMHAYSDDQYRKIKVQLDAKQVDYRVQRYRGLASMNESVLVATCINRNSRHRHVCSVDDAQAALRIFAGEF